VSNKQCDQTNIAMATKAMMTGTLLAAAAAEGEAWALD
jgi:ABC-type phosphate transport system permease subunit